MHIRGSYIPLALTVRKNGQNTAKRVEKRCCALYTTHIKPVLQQIMLLTGLNIGGKTRSFS